ncbi:MAG: Smr/MutS family protein [Muribaculaceae bacterium]
MIYPQNFETKIGFDTLRKDIAKKCISPLGIAECNAMLFSSNYDTVISRLNETKEFLNIIQDGVEFPLNYIYDVTSQLNSIRIAGTYLNESDLFNLKRSLITISEIVAFFTNKDETTQPPYPYLSMVTKEMIGFPGIVKEIESILDKFGNIKDNASPALNDIKKAINSTMTGINGLLRRIINEGRQSGILDKDTTPSMRDGRLVIPVAPMYKRKIRGIVHDESATGKTIFIEPAEIVEANNNIRELEGEMRREIIRILINVTNNIRPYIDELLNSYSIIGKLDFVKAKALFANELGGLLPNIEKEPQLELYHAVHPVLFMALREQGKTVVPLNLTLNTKDRILLISGPNAGGKSVCLKTVGIIQYMTQCGMLPPVYENSHIGIYKNIFIDIGDEQSIEDDLSTYSSHLNNMKHFVNNGDDSTILLIDEFGGGTEPQIGGAIAQAILHQLNEKKTFGVITTHYQNLKHFAEDTPGIINGAMLYDRQKMQPLFQLSIGYPGSSFAVEIARKIGLPAEVITEAESIVGSDYINMDKYLLDIARDKKYWENKRQDIRIKEKKLEAIVEKYNAEVDIISREHKEIIKTAKNEAKEILAQSNASIERTIHEIKIAQAEKERTKEVRKQLDEYKSSLNSANSHQLAVKKIERQNHQKKENEEKKKQTEKNTKIGINDYVMLDTSPTIGKVLSIEGKNAIVAFGNLKTNVQTSRLKKSDAHSFSQIKRDATFISTSTSTELRQKQLKFKQEIDVRGMRADEAIQAVTYFIDDAIQFRSKQVRILHGTGSGILRQCIREYLNTVSGIQSFRDEHIQLGGAGITVIELL